mgnify:CR=1 FL=1
MDNKKVSPVVGSLVEKDNKTECTKISLLATLFNGILKNNPGLCQLLGLCPLLAVTTSAVSALGLAFATILVMCASSVVISFLRRFILKEVRIPIYVLFIATLVTVVRFYCQAYFPDLYAQLGIYLALIVTNCIIMGRAEAYAKNNTVLYSFVDALGCGIGFGLVLFVLGSIREILGSGTLFVGASSLFGEFGQALECNIINSDYTIMVAILPPGGFFVLAFLIAYKNFMANYKRHKIENSFKINSIQN